MVRRHPGNRLRDAGIRGPHQRRNGTPAGHRVHPVLHSRCPGRDRRSVLRRLRSAGPPLDSRGIRPGGAGHFQPAVRRQPRTPGQSCGTWLAAAIARGRPVAGCLAQSRRFPAAVTTLPRPLPAGLDARGKGAGLAGRRSNRLRARSRRPVLSVPALWQGLQSSAASGNTAMRRSRPWKRIGGSSGKRCRGPFGAPPSMPAPKTRRPGG